MAARAPLLTHREQTVHRAGDRAAQEQQIPLGIDPNHSEAELSEAAGAPLYPRWIDLCDVGPRGTPAGRAPTVPGGAAPGAPAATGARAARPTRQSARPAPAPPL